MTTGYTNLQGSSTAGYHNNYPIPGDNTLFTQAVLKSTLEPFANNIDYIEKQITSLSSQSYVPSSAEIVMSYSDQVFLCDSSTTSSVGLPDFTNFSFSSGSYRLDTATEFSGGLANFVFSTGPVSGGYTSIAKASSHYIIEAQLSLFGQATQYSGMQIGTSVNCALFCVNSGSNVYTIWPGNSVTQPNGNFLSWQSVGGYGLNSTATCPSSTTLNFNMKVSADPTVGSTDTLVFYLAAVKAVNTAMSYPVACVLNPQYGVHPPLTFYARVTSY